MFTVIICGKALLKAIKEEHSHILDLITNDPQCAICLWNKDAVTFKEAVPELDNITAGRTEWRAVILQDSNTFGIGAINKRNPFDAVDAMKTINDFGEEEIVDMMRDFLRMRESRIEKGVEISEKELQFEAAIREKIEESGRRITAFREQKCYKYFAATENPLTKLAVWMLGTPIKEMPAPAKDWPESFSAEKLPVDWDYYEKAVQLDVLPTEIEIYRSLCAKRNAVTSRFDDGSLLRRRPSEVLVFSERYGARVEDSFNDTDKCFSELEYDNFADDNLYPDQLRYAICDVFYENTNRESISFLKFTSLMLMVIKHPMPEGIMRAHRVYNLNVTIDEKKARKFFTKYLRKLEATKRLLTAKIKQLEAEMGVKEDDLTLEETMELFEKGVDIPVKVRTQTDTKDFLAEHKIGLARNCPREEYDYWYKQVTEITKRFLRYLREPRRAVKHAAKNDLRANWLIEDERILRLNEDRLEDIQFRLEEEEQKMVETVTTNLYNTKQYTDTIDQADQVVRKGIFKRITTGKIFLTSGVVLFAALLGFAPLLIKNAGSVAAFGTSLLVTGIAVGSLVLAGLIFLVVNKLLQVRRYKHFNAAMLEILARIEGGMQAFSRYLSHACNVMRQFSVFTYLGKPHDIAVNILKKHLFNVQTKINGVNGLFVSIMEIDGQQDAAPYEFDFSKDADYIYEVPYNPVESVAEYIVKDNMVEIPIDYVKNVTIKREELYD